MLNIFFRKSCLGINVEKTTIIPNAARNNVDFIRSIEEWGFSVDSKFKILDYKIDKKYLRSFMKILNLLLKNLIKYRPSGANSNFLYILNVYKCYMLSKLYVLRDSAPQIEF